KERRPEQEWAVAKAGEESADSSGLFGRARIQTSTPRPTTTREAMQRTTQHLSEPRPLGSGRFRRSLTVAALLLLEGCQSLKLAPQPAERAADKGEKEPVLGAPVKYTLRVSQFLFYSDFKLKEDQPLFRELAELRDQVQKDLQLPSSSTLVQVYLFE